MQPARELADLLRARRRARRSRRRAARRARRPRRAAGRGSSSTEVSRCCAPSWRLRWIRRRSASATSTSRAREARSSRLGPLAVGDVAQVAGEGRRPGQRDPRDRQLDRELACRRGACRSARAGGRGSTRVLGLEEARQAAPVRVAQRRRHDQVGHLAADRLGRRGSRRSPRRRGSSRSRARWRPSSPRRRAPPRASPAAATRCARTSSSARRPRDELPDLAAERVHRRQQPLVGLAQLARRRTPSRRRRRAGCAAGSRTPACRPPRRAASARGKFASSGASTIHAGSPLDEHAARAAPRPAPSVSALAERLELAGAPSPRVPGAHAAQAAVVRVDLPDGAELPAERAADRLERGRRRPRQAARFPRGSARPRAPRAARSRASATVPAVRPRRCHDLKRRYTRRRARRPSARRACASSSPTTTRCCARASRRCSRTPATRSSAARSDARRPAAQGALLRAGRRDRRRPHAARQRRRRARGRRRDPPRRIRRSRCSCSPSTSSRPTCSSSSATTPRASATCSRTACATSPSSSTRSSASRGGTAFDPEVVKSLVGGRRGRAARRAHRPRARACSSLIAEGRSNRAIAEAALPQPARRRAPRPGHLPEAAASPTREDDNRRVLAVLALLGH